MPLPEERSQSLSFSWGLLFSPGALFPKLFWRLCQLTSKIQLHCPTEQGLTLRRLRGKFLAGASLDRSRPQSFLRSVPGVGVDLVLFASFFPLIAHPSGRFRYRLCQQLLGQGPQCLLKLTSHPKAVFEPGCVRVLWAPTAPAHAGKRGCLPGKWVARWF